MANIKSEDRRVKNSKENITRAFSQLLKAKSIDDISITEICQLAKVNRGTFYNYYKDPYDLRKKIKDEFIEKFTTYFTPLLFTKSPDNLIDFDFIYKIVSFLKENQVTVNAIVDKQYGDQGFLNDILNAGYQFVTFVYPRIYNDISSEDISIFYKFASGGAVSLLLDWINNDMAMPVDLVSKKLNALITALLTYFKK